MPLSYFWCGFLFGYGAGVGTLYRTEALRAIIGREALHGAWLVPKLYGEPFLTKPPGMYVAIATASMPFGEVTTISARLPSVFAATIAVFAFFLAFRCVVDRRLALAGAMLMPVSFLWLDRAPSAEIDMLQMMWVSGAILCFWRAVELEEARISHEVPFSRDAESSERSAEASRPSALRSEDFASRLNKSAVWWLLALLCVTGGFLTKWTAPAFFYLTAITLLAWRRRLDLLWSRRHLLALQRFDGHHRALGPGSFRAASVGWPCRFRDAFLAEATQRFDPNHGGRAYPWLESLSYPFQVLIANMLWTLLAIFACRPAFVRQWDENGRRLLQLFHCWAWPNLLFWSLPGQHHVRYSPAGRVRGWWAGEWWRLPVWARTQSECFLPSCDA